MELLIGANCVEALQPLEVIPSQQEGPYVYKTILGWYVVGNMVDEKQDAFSCNWIAVLQAESGSVAKHHFEVQNKYEYIGITEMLRKIYMSDFQDTSSQREDSITVKISQISNEDTETVKVGNHYQTPLPLKNPDVKLPNNRKIAERRLLYLKKRVIKHDRFHQQYTEFKKLLIQEILEAM